MVYVWFIAGLAVLVVGAELLVRGAVVLAAAARISSLVIGLTVVAFGTSAPELAVSAISSLKGDAAIALGNVVGSNVFNLLAVLASASLLSKSGVEVNVSVLWFDLLFMVWVALLCWPMFKSHGMLSRTEGGVMLLLYIVYTIILILDAQSFEGIQQLKDYFAYGAVPLIVLVTCLLAWREHKRATVLSKAH